MNTTDKLIHFANSINKIDTNPYFTKIKKAPPLQSFINSQKGFVSAVDYWSKLLAQLLVILPSDETRITIVKNLYDEHGNGDKEKTHVKTFNSFLQSLGFEGEAIPYTQTDSYSPVKQFNDRLQRQFQGGDWLYCVCMMAMIEFMYVRVSKLINEYVSNFLNPEDVHHYSTHETVDETHALDMFKLIEPFYASRETTINSAFVFGYNTMYQLYTDLASFL